MSLQKHAELIKILEARFVKNAARHEGIDWQNVHSRLINSEDKLHILNEMERTGGEPDVIGFDKTTGEFIFCDCSQESPTGRRSLCYDKVALDGRKENKPKGNAEEVAATMGVELLSESDYRALQELGEFDKKTSSWIKTPPAVRKLGGALFCDRRYGQVFTYHNGAESYYAARGFRGQLKV
ncbi:MAG TPA: DUF4256 domain-containing protein [Cellvibrionaceae bacterium]